MEFCYVAVIFVASFSVANADQCSIPCKHDISKCCPQPEQNVCKGDTRGNRK